MSLFRRKSRGKSLRRSQVFTADLASGLFPGPHAVPVPVRHAPSHRRRRRNASYASGRSRLPMFRVT